MADDDANAEQPSMQSVLDALKGTPSFDEHFVLEEYPPSESGAQPSFAVYSKGNWTRDEEKDKPRVLVTGNTADIVWMVQTYCSRRSASLRERLFVMAPSTATLPSFATSVAWDAKVHCPGNNNEYDFPLEADRLSIHMEDAARANDGSFGCIDGFVYDAKNDCAMAEIIFLRCRAFNPWNLPTNLLGFSQLSHLRIYDTCCGLQLRPGDFESLAQLTSFTLRSARVEILPDSFCQLNKLRTLKLEGVQQLPGGIGDLQELESLIWSCSRIAAGEDFEADSASSLPPGFARLRNLRVLELRGLPNFEGLPDDFGDLHCLTELSLCNLPNMPSLPERFGDLQSLTNLHCQLDKLDTFPESFGRLRILEDLFPSRHGTAPDASTRNLCASQAEETRGVFLYQY